MIVLSFRQPHPERSSPVKRPYVLGILGLAALALTLVGCSSSTTTGGKPAGDKSTLKIGYSDWPGWLVWEIAKQKDFFKEAGVNAELVWFEDYGASIEAYTAGKLD